MDAQIKKKQKKYCRVKTSGYGVLATVAVVKVTLTVAP